MDKTDLRVSYEPHSRIVTLHAATERGLAFLREKMQSAGWQWMGQHTLCIDFDFAFGAVSLALDEGLVVR